MVKYGLKIVNKWKILTFWGYCVLVAGYLLLVVSGVVEVRSPGNVFNKKNCEWIRWGSIEVNLQIDIR